VQRIFHGGLAAAAKAKRDGTLSLSERLVLALARRLIFRKVQQRLGGRLRFAFTGAAAISPAVAEFIDAVGIPVHEGYGMTELSGVCTLNPPGATRIGSVGKTVPGFSIRIAGAARPGDEGEIEVAGDGVMQGYHGLPEETAATVSEDGWLRTGDLGRFGAEGYLYVTGRVKEIYKLENGRYVAPARLEESITLSPFIAQAFVHGMNRPSNVALIVPDRAALVAWAEREGIPSADYPALCDLPATRALVREELDRAAHDWKGYERISDFVIVPDELSVSNDMLTPTLKVKRRNVMKRWGGALEKLYEPAPRAPVASTRSDAFA
jgi:long-chain acyl-CoA synthetase